jgi:hypothetical protein
MTLLFTLLFFIYAGNIYAGGKSQVQSNQDLAALQPYQTQFESNRNEQSASNEQPASNIRAEQVMKALAAAYPQRISKVEFKDGDWAVLLYDTWYYYEGGRLLSDKLRSSADSYSPQAFYNYPVELPPWMEPAPEAAARFRDMASNRNRGSTRRSSTFFDELWRVHNRDESYQRVKSFRFLGHPTMVHYSILTELSLVEERILVLAKTKPHIQTWINNINTADSWNWRNIADTQARSFHSYGAAIDILPKSLAGKETYWLWASNKRSDWWNVSYNERYHPPIEIIQAFEAYGFVWGGKWLFYDTMHFEYRPEVLLLCGMELDKLW